MLLNVYIVSTYGVRISKKPQNVDLFYTKAIRRNARGNRCKYNNSTRNNPVIWMQWLKQFE